MSKEEGWSKIVDAIIVLLMIVVCAICLFVLLFLGWWAYSYIVNDIVEPYNDPEPPGTSISKSLTKNSQEILVL